MSCRKVRRDLLEEFRFRADLGSGSSPHLAHLESCAACREEVGIDQALVEQLRRALRERVEGSAPSAASWEMVRQRTLESPRRPWALRLLRWGRVLPAALAGVMMFAVAISSEAGQAQRTQSPLPVTPVIQQAVLQQDDADDWQPPWWSKYRGPHEAPALPSGHMVAVMPDQASSVEMPPVSGRQQ